MSIPTSEKNIYGDRVTDVSMPAWQKRAKVRTSLGH